MTRLAAETGETVNLAVLQDGEIVYLLSESGSRLLSTHTPIGTAPARPLHRAGQVPARAAAGGDGARRRRARALRAADARHRDDVGGPAAGARAHPPRRRRALVGGVRDRAGVDRGARSRWLDGPGSAALNVSLPTSRATRAFRPSWSAACATIAARIEASLAAHGR